jgi:ribosomal protein S18 acetylase RimI-like enzyme
VETRVEVRKVKESELSFLREMAIQTFRETFGFDNTETQLEDYFNASYTPSNFIAEYEDDETDTFFLIKGDEKVGFLKVSWGSAQTESLLDDAFEIQRIYILKEYQGQGFGKVFFEFALQKAVDSGHEWAWLGVWEKNYRAQSFYKRYGFEKFAEHSFPVGEKIDTDWLLKKSLKK